jgi:hypothetical protein
MKLNEVTGPNSRTASILNEGYQDLNEAQILYLGKFEKELWPLVEQYTKLAEAELTKQQVLDIFGGAEQVAMDGGDNKTMAGKVGAGAAAAAKLPIDLAKKVDAKINQLGKLAKNAGPVKNADQKFADLKKQITANNSDSKVVQGIQKISDWAKENPGKASIAVGILTTIAAFAAGPAGGAAAGLILRSTKELLQGEDLSTAVGKSVKTAAYGAIAGWALDGLGDWLEGIRADSVPYDKVPGLTTVNVDMRSTFEVPGFSQVRELGAIVVPKERAQEFLDLVTQVKGGDTGAFNEIYKFAKSFDVQDAIKDMNVANAASKAIAIANDDFLANLTNANDAIAALAQGTVTGKMDAKDIKVDGEPMQGELDLKGGGMAQPVDKNFDKDQKLSDFGKVGETMSMEERFELYLAEAEPAQGELPLNNPNTLGAKMKRGLGKAASAVGGKIKQTAKNVGNKVTADKLTKAWKKLGEPLDSGSIANILADAGMSNDQIQSIGQTSKVELEPTADASGADTAQKGADTAQPTAKAAPAVKDAPIAKGTVINKGGKDYEWAGALWIDAATKKPLGVQSSYDMGLPNPKFTAIINAAKKDPELAKLIKVQLTAKGVKPATAGAAKAATAGVKGTEKLKTA